ncbi:ribose 1,5-bisphosphokinase [Paracoccus isoporae]|uniref:Ribose 1,5-bisphosphokinase n=1 Tax=Paracoccus isoporae TaxID=591205 RepID=A0A1G6U1F3_9RHOB|nr:AAA family ATPase [Paracoccus isoporae]SDD35158.1 ribose 1,5-bisphosphokinase [Paracoccus isoporae]
MSLSHIAVVGPSGAGKDTLMRQAASALPDVTLVRRAITRPADRGSEDFEPVTEAEFLRRREAGELILDWQAHGLRYGIPRPHGAQGHAIRLVNLSRGVLREAASVLPDLSVIHVTADPETLAARLVARGREAPDEIALRVARDARLDAAGLRVITIDNSGALAQACAAFNAAVRELSE